MLVPHVSVEVELFELSESTKTQQAEDLLAEVVAEVTVGPDFLKGTAVLYSRGRRWILLYLPIVLV